ncbi:unnamed protein product [Echinostoma caproni]|uniref:ABC transporter substrate-binding protein n=1 Tax=Echinostoma caproni TaxID=27848 RepID=A0A183ARQ1_9TREM|nr:unnamed protein product [Echinostoma caproni]
MHEPIVRLWTPYYPVHEAEFEGFLGGPYPEPLAKETGPQGTGVEYEVHDPLGASNWLAGSYAFQMWPTIQDTQIALEPRTRR